MAKLADTLVRYRVHERVAFARAEAQSQSTRSALADAWMRRGRSGSPPTPANDHKTPSKEELIWPWATTAYSERNFHRQQTGIQTPATAPFPVATLDPLYGGPLSFHLKRFCSYRVGPYTPQTDPLECGDPNHSVPRD
jgi:hypothetical protein